MFKIHKGIVLIAVVIVLSVFIYYRYAAKVFQASKNEEAVLMTESVPVGSKEVSAVATFDTPGDYAEHLRFIVTVDTQGVIESVKTVDAATNEIPEKKIEFNDGLLVVIKGKKLSELTAIDNVGKSSLTTAAFNSVIDQMKAQL
ncbi:MAG: hypothetical protein AAB547_03200 [Patescibacteria group bacterium]